MRAPVFIRKGDRNIAGRTLSPVRDNAMTSGRGRYR